MNTASLFCLLLSKPLIAPVTVSSRRRPRRLRGALASHCRAGEYEFYAPIENLLSLSPALPYHRYLCVPTADLMLCQLKTKKRIQCCCLFFTRHNTCDIAAAKEANDNMNDVASHRKAAAPRRTESPPQHFVLTRPHLKMLRHWCASGVRIHESVLPQ